MSEIQERETYLIPTGTICPTGPTGTTGPTGPPGATGTGRGWNRWQRLWYIYLCPERLRDRFTDGMFFRNWLMYELWNLGSRIRRR